MQLTTYFKKLISIKSLLLTSIMLGLLYANPALADSTSSTTPALLISNFTIISKVMLAVSILMGIALFAGGMFQLKRYGEMRTMMSHQMTLAKPMMLILAGVSLIALPWFIPLGLMSFWSSASPLQYQGGPEGYDAYIPPVLVFVRVIGIGAFMRGLVLLARSGGQGGQPGTTGRALMHLFGGILAVHILGSVHLLEQIMGWI